MTWTRVIIDTVTNATNRANSVAYAASHDGSVIIGQYVPNPSNPVQAFSWTEGGGITTLPITDVIPVVGAQAYACSSNGLTVGGLYNKAGIGYTAAAWVNGSPFFFDPPSGLSNSTVFGVSGDGSIFVGTSNSNGTACYWSGVSEAAVSLPLPGYITDFSLAVGVNHDGSLIVGYGGDDSGNTHALLWENFTTVVDIGQLPGGGLYPVELNAISNTSNVAVGYATDASSAPQPISYATPSGPFTELSAGVEAFGVSDDGSVIVTKTSGGGTSYIITSGSADMLDNYPYLVTNVSGDGTRPIGTSPALYWYSTTPPSGTLINLGNVVVNSVLAESPCTVSQYGVAPLTSPSVGLRWSDTRGATWGEAVPQAFGTDEYAQIKWSRTGYARDRVFELFWSVAAPTAINGAFVVAKPFKT